MARKASIEDRVKELSEKEKKLRLQLDNDSDEMKDRIKQVGKIALIVGGVALVGYWLFNLFSDEDEEVKPKKKKMKKSSPNTTARISAVIMPYLNKFLEGVLNEEEGDQKKTKERPEKEANP